MKTARRLRGIGTRPQRVRAPVARGLLAPAVPADSPVPAEPAIERAGGDRRAGVIRDAAIVTRGEALGHGMWLDREFLGSVAQAINDQADGVKARFTHPGLSGDGLGTFLGRAKAAYVENDVVRADIHFSQSAHKTPDGDLAGYVMDLADEDPDEFGMSIVYWPDEDAEEKHRVHWTTDGDFRSPDPDNADHLPHARLARLFAADVVDEPAANPGGLFHRGAAIAREADAVAEYSLGLAADRPAVVTLGVDADRVRAWLARFLDAHGLAVVNRKQKERPMPMLKNSEVATQLDEPAGDEDPAGGAEAAAPDSGGAEAPPAPAADETSEGEGQSGSGGEAESASEGQVQDSSPQSPIPSPQDEGRAECRRWIEAFGPVVGPAWYAAGELTFEQARERQIAALQAERDALQAKIAAIPRGEATPLSFQDAEKPDRGKGRPKGSTMGDNLDRLVSFNREKLPA